MPRKQRRRSWGSITEAGRGKYILRWVENTPDGRKRKSHTFYGTYKEADAELARIRVRVGDDAPVPTVGQAYEMWWLPRAKKRVEEGTLSAGSYDLYTAAWRNVAAPKWAKTPVDSIKPAAVQEWLNTVAKGNATHAMVVLKQAVDYAVKYETVATNKFRIGYDMPSSSRRERSKDVYDLARARAMLSTVRGSRIEAAYILAAFGSCRTGESLAARVEDVEAVDSGGARFATVHIRRRMKQVGRAPVDALKTDSSVRHIIVPPPYSERLLQLTDDARAVGTPWLSDRGDGTPMNVGMLFDEWTRLAGTDKIPFANLRNSWRTFAQAEWRVDYDVLEMLMGHALPGVTGRHYLRMSVEQVVDVFAADYLKNAVI